MSNVMLFCSHFESEIMSANEFQYGECVIYLLFWAIIMLFGSNRNENEIFSLIYANGSFHLCAKRENIFSLLRAELLVLGQIELKSVQNQKAVSTHMCNINSLDLTVSRHIYTITHFFLLFFSVVNDA